MSLDCGDDDDEADYCPQCNGSGEGMYDRSTCSLCRGSGHESTTPNDNDNFQDWEPEHDDY